MAEPLRFHPLVADDLEAAANWYDDISPELGREQGDTRKYWGGGAPHFEG